MSNVLEINDLVVSYRTARGHLTAVDGISLHLAPGETLGLVGESGCGKSSLGKAIVQLVEPSAGSIRVEGHDLSTRSRAERRALRPKIQMVFQDPMGALDPRQQAGTILETPLKLHGLRDAAARRARVATLMEQVGLRPEFIDRLPHEFSGGQRQRLGIARALALNPSVIVCDEPVSALDVSLQAQVLNLLRRVQQAQKVSYLFISHDLSVVEHIADRVAIMYLGKIVEVAPRSALWRTPAHPYTRALIEALPRTDPARHRIADKQVIGGDLPSPYNPPAGCRLHTRCPLAFARCAVEEPKLATIGDGHSVACHLHDAAVAKAA
ncbi:ABC transporter ATP-binding protein [Azorhizobium oxalatiphilum]|uniref:ABC transporter ATP-binding protein n=1 Tax=Azorhizobium oxalatiphilum TaxID=980631 RepID=A0A917BV44_9HYPH|nr:oligopeptide/dipeptide ABC transporter ATP-binding protein [Azorhizobium oxalatiphilum]GGF58541.1 ABC transporter ATP-binding protein [Azorhizobium oxalatiphilum]